MARRQTPRTSRSRQANHDAAPALPGQVVLVLQGGGALGAYQGGVYEALHESGIEPDWVIGTSIGAINGALIAGNPPQRRLERLRAFWKAVEQPVAAPAAAPQLSVNDNAACRFWTMMAGIPAFFTPNPMAWLGQYAPVGVENASYYTTLPLRHTLSELLEPGYLNAGQTRLALGAVNVHNGEMTYFDSRKGPLGIDHILASGALPPAFPAVRIGDAFYWDGGIYSNTPIEAVLDDNPRRSSLIFTVDVWRADGSEPSSLWQVAGREKEIKYASRAKSHIARQKQIHHLRHVILELAKAMPPKMRQSPAVKELVSWGCQTMMHVVPLMASAIAGEDQTKDIDFTADSIRARWQAGYADTRRMLDLAPWRQPVDPIEGIIIHDGLAHDAPSMAAGIDGFQGRTK
ncbi:MAG TPA: patatin-like phospholipase family protein [Noviherbaspirillum sp.]|nr:patatin-like phospholipase family protein [Noviherbaspirillum sp.]